jgi:D-tyrosyl-tRNA(Tyr) deacylase
MLSMRAVVQRVAEAEVDVDGVTVGDVGRGFLVLVGATHSDTEADAVAIADKIAGLRVFTDADGLMNRALGDVGGACLVVSQFTLYGSTRKGRRPSFTDAARPELAEPLVAAVTERLRSNGIPVSTGVFGAMMSVSLVNDGPVTLILESVDGRIV